MLTDYTVRKMKQRCFVQTVGKRFVVDEHVKTERKAFSLFPAHPELLVIVFKFTTLYFLTAPVM